jgi:hypothetical protein
VCAALSHPHKPPVEFVRIGAGNLMLCGLRFQGVCSTQPPTHTAGGIRPNRCREFDVVWSEVSGCVQHLATHTHRRWNTSDFVAGDFIRGFLRFEGVCSTKPHTSPSSARTAKSPRLWRASQGLELPPFRATATPTSRMAPATPMPAPWTPTRSWLIEADLLTPSV